MKFRPAGRSGGMVVELSPKETQELPLLSGERGEPLLVFRLKKILVPLDFSTCSSKALQYALPFARQFKAALILVHAVQLPVAAPEMIFADAPSVADARAELERLAKTIDFAPCHCNVRIGAPATEIIEAAVESGTDLIILSTHGRSGLAHMILGSTAERVVRQAPCPVLVVREKEQDFVTPKSV